MKMFKKAKPALLAVLLGASLLLAACSKDGATSTPQTTSEPPAQATSEPPTQTEQQAGAPVEQPTGRPGENGVISGTLVDIGADGSFTLSTIDDSIEVPVKPEGTAEWIYEVADEEAGSIEEYPLVASELASYTGELVIVQGSWEGETFTAARIMVRIFE